MRKLLILSITIFYVNSAFAMTPEDYENVENMNDTATTETLQLSSNAKSSDLINAIVENGQVVAASELPFILIEPQEDGDYELPIHIMTKVSYGSIEEILRNSPAPEKERLPVLVLASLDSTGAVKSVTATVAKSDSDSIISSPLGEELLPPVISL
jgi:hypothetical protein